MALTDSVLAAGLAALEPTGDVNVAIQRVADAYHDYFQGASVSGVPVTPGASDPGKAAMISAMGGLNSDAASALQSGIVAYWQALATLGTTLWVVPGFTTLPAVTPPPGISALSSPIQSTFDSNLSSQADLNTASSNVASAIHAAHSGGTVTLQPPVGAPVPTPIV